MLGFKQKCSLITGSNGRERDIQVEHATLPWSEEETSEAVRDETRLVFRRDIGSYTKRSCYLYVYTTLHACQI